MVITVKFVGALRHISGTDKLAVAFNERASVRTTIGEIIEGRPELRHSLMDLQHQDPRLNTLILVNGREISVLDGLETTLKDGDEVVLISFVHGG